MEAQVHKAHRQKKEKKKPTSTGEKNPKAFAFSNPGKLARSAARSHDIKEKRLHVPLVDRLPDEPPPRLVTIVGPPGVGKTTLLKSLIRRYTKEPISDPQGPITIVTSKKQRLTFLECPNELEAMVDVAKVCDVVLLMIDGNYGFEMETMEFLNVLASTGMPGNVFTVLTHLDLFKKPHALKEAKRRLKRRLWNELYQGAHLFYLSGVINGRYPDREIHNLSRYLSIMKNPRPLIWRNTHPYALIDSFRDITHPTKIEADEKCDRSIVLSGYLRGTNFTDQGQRVHIPGVGDYSIARIEALPDPCPTPAMEQALAKVTGKTGRRKRLDEKERKIHAPMSDRSGLKIDGDAIWITREKGFQFHKDSDGTGERGEGEEIMIGLQNERRLLGQTDEGVQLFSGGQKIHSLDAAPVDDEEQRSGRKTHRKPRFAEHQNDEEDQDFDGLDDDDEEAADDPGEAEPWQEQKLGRLFRKKQTEEAREEEEYAFADSDSDLGSISSASDREDNPDDSDCRDDDDDEEEEEEEEEEVDSEEEAAVRWKVNLHDTASRLRGQRKPYQISDLAKLLYDMSITPTEAIRKWKGEAADAAAEVDDTGDDDDEFFTKKASAEGEEQEDHLLPRYDSQWLAAKWSRPDLLEEIRAKFTTFRRRKPTTQGEGEEDAEDEDVDEDEDEDDEGSEDEFSGLDDDDDDVGDGAFEDLETGEVHGPKEEGVEAESAEDIEAEREKNAQRKEELKQRFEEEDREGFFNDKAQARREAGPAAEEFGEDEWYDAQKARMQRQLDINKAEFESLDEHQRIAVEGHRAGQYAKIVLEGVPAEFVERFSTRRPILVGGLSATEDRFGFVQVRIKRHRWHKKILKTNDPLIVSLGWRRFQTMPIYSTSDNRVRNRMLKYTPEHMHCFGTFYGPLIAPNTGFVCFNSFSSQNPSFRVAATGTVLNVDESVEIVKKLKLTGTPYKIFKNTAFIKGMFNSSLEIAKFEGAAVKTVSGIRGQIKRALSKPEGHFRATFEDRVLISDIVFLRAWYPIKPHRFYNPALNLIGWQPMRLTGEVRRAENLPTPLNKSSQYRKIERQNRHFNDVKIPRQLAARLPYQAQIVAQRKQNPNNYVARRVVVPDAHEQKSRALVTMLSTIRQEKEAKRDAKKEEKRAEFRKKMAALEEKKTERERKEKKDFWQKEGRKRQAPDQGGSNKRSRS